jgi:hypothetical protein
MHLSLDSSAGFSEGGALAMEQPHSEETVRDLLERRERELMQQIELLQSELAALRNDLTPKEVELIEVRRVKAVLGMTAGRSFSDIASLPHRSEHRSDKSAADRENAYRSLATTIRDTPHNALTIKELLVLAFVEHFQVQGAAPADLKAQIQASYGREIDSGSIRPNLARLREDGIVMRAIPPKWMLQPVAANIIAPVYFDGDLLRAATALAWRDDAATPYQPSESQAREALPQSCKFKVVRER